MGANPDYRENLNGRRVPATSPTGSDEYVVNPKDHADGFVVSEFFNY